MERYDIKMFMTVKIAMMTIITKSEGCGAATGGNETTGSYINGGSTPIFFLPSQLPQFLLLPKKRN